MCEHGVGQEFALLRHCSVHAYQPCTLWRKHCIIVDGALQEHTHLRLLVQLTLQALLLDVRLAA